MTRVQEYEPLYDAFQQFLQRCLLDDGSLLWPTEQAWTLENVAELRRRMVDTPMFGGDLSFEEKLEKQMQGASAKHWMVLSDVYYVYYLPSDYIKFDTKVANVRWAAQQGGGTPPPETADAWEAQKHGFTRTSMKYHMKYAQFWLILLFAEYVKEHPQPETVVKNHQEMQRVLDGILEDIPDKTDRAYGMRHAMLYLAFPEKYERIISTRDKERIVETYGSRIEGPGPDDLDEAIRRIRTALSPEYDEPERVFDFYDPELKKQWRADARGRRTPDKKIAEEKAKDEYLAVGEEEALEELADVLGILDQTRNLILHGPPGTGKTYIAKKAAEALVRRQVEQPLSERAVRLQAIEDLTGYEMLALSLYHAGANSTYSVPEIMAQPLVQMRFQVRPVKHPSNSVWFYLQQHTHPESKTVNVAERRPPYLFDKDAKGRWCLTQEGREYVRESLADRLAVLNRSRAEHTIDRFVMWTTFHQSYAYEDFVEGLRPVSAEDASGQISYEIVPGVFRRICARAIADPDSKYVLVIDEINRGNIAKILGELITLLEDDKRLGQANALSIVLPYSGETFSVPGNLYVISTMNTADRSIALLDVALRRRFAFLELMPRPELLDGFTVESAEAAVPLGALLRGLNQGIRQFLDRDHQIGHSYFLEVSARDADERADALDFVWNHRIMPLLEEYFYGQRDRLIELLAPFLTDVDAGLQGLETEEMEAEIGRLEGDDLLVALARLAQKHSEGKAPRAEQ
ncbi:MAG: AAA family ATPase [Anaerolineae bacterium]|nr:AAA family ATPase [Anaerolineae bacterium]